MTSQRCGGGQPGVGPSCWRHGSKLFGGPLSWGSRLWGQLASPPPVAMEVVGLSWVCPRIPLPWLSKALGCGGVSLWVSVTSTAGPKAESPHPGTALIFIPTSPPPPWTPSPSPPSAQVQLKTWVLGTFCGDGEKISRRLWRTPHTVYLSFYVYSAFLVLQITMTQRSLSVYFCSPVQLSPRAKHKDVIDALLYFRFKDRITGRKRQEAYNEAQKACATLFLSVPMATLV